MKNILLIIVIASFVGASATCKKNPFVERVYRFSFKNNSQDTISIATSLKYPDTAITHIERYEVIMLYPGETAPIDSKKEWEKVINEDIPGKKLLVFVFSVPVDDNNWNHVKVNYLVKKRYELTVDDMNNVDWIVAYP